MSGFTKHKYEKDYVKVKTDFSKIIRRVSSILPYNFGFNDLISLIQKYYPFEYRIWDEKYRAYKKWNESLRKTKKRTRYPVTNLEQIIKQLDVTKELFSESYRTAWEANYSETRRIKIQSEIEAERAPKIKKRQQRIDKAIAKTQQVEPEYLDALMGLYDRKNTSQKDRMYIMIELEKYYCHKVLVFFQRKAHSELNFQLRERAVRHLLALGHYAELRRQKYMRINTRNKKRKEYLRIYAKEKFNIDGIPEELEYRINNSKDQKLVGYDFFISHSSSDYKAVQSTISFLNQNGKVIYCDWINDTDYLKRYLVGKATLAVIKKRIEQAGAILFVDSPKSRQSNWVRYELNYAMELGKPLYRLSVFDVIHMNFSYNTMDNEWFFDKNYTDRDLFDERT